MADATDSRSVIRKGVRVQAPLPTPIRCHGGAVTQWSAKPHTPVRLWMAAHPYGGCSSAG